MTYEEYQVIIRDYTRAIDRRFGRAKAKRIIEKLSIWDERAAERLMMYDDANFGV